MILYKSQSINSLCIHIQTVYLLFLVNVDTEDVALDIAEGQYTFIIICRNGRDLIIMIPDLLLAIDDIANIPK